MNDVSSFYDTYLEMFSDDDFDTIDDQMDSILNHLVYFEGYLARFYYE